ncbi:hypothetical protein Plec18170_003713 [Paecilomyces lecythidis]
MTATTAATPSPLPVPPRASETDTSETDKGTPAVIPSPTLRLHIQDLRHPAATAFLRLVPDITAVLETALADIIHHLYTPPKHTSRDNNHNSNNNNNNKPIPSFSPTVPPTRSVTVILRDFSGVAYTTGTDLDNDHKEIHFSLSYIRTASTYPDPRKELAGVLTHELVHCYQHTTPPSPSPSSLPSPSDNSQSPTNDSLRPPGGLIEGIADFVRLKAHLDPPHWKRPASATDRPDRWDAGYQHTAFFLAWLEDVRVGTGAIGLLNDRLFRVGYIGDDIGPDTDTDPANDHDNDQSKSSSNGFWKALFGADITGLWDEYGQYLDGGKGPVRAAGNWEDEIVNPE